MHLKYEGATFQINLQSSIERSLFKKAIKKRIGKWIGKPYRTDAYLQFARANLASIEAPIVVDVGANIGTTVLPLAIQFPNAQFYAAEPHPTPASRFLENCRYNQIRNVKLIAAAIGMSNKMAQIHTCPTNSGGHRLTGFQGRQEIEDIPQFGSIFVPLKPLIALFQECNIQHCDILKIDTEGYEVSVLNSLQDHLRPDIVTYVVAEFGPEGLRRAGVTGWDLVAPLLKRGYECRILETDHAITSEKDIPLLPDYSVADFVFSPANKKSFRGVS